MRTMPQIGATLKRAICRTPIRLICVIMSPLFILLLGLVLHWILSGYKDLIINYLMALPSMGAFFTSIRQPLDVLLDFIPTGIVAVLTGLAFLLGDWRAYLRALHSVRRISAITKLFASNQFKAILHSEKKITFNKGLVHSLDALPIEAGADLTPGQFAGLCGIMARFYPDRIVGVWNTLWYPLEQVYELNGHNFRTMATWLPYFGALEEAYDSHLDDNTNSRFLIVADDFTWSILRKKPIWNHLFDEQRKNKVHDVFLIRETDYFRKMHDNSVHVPEFGDFAVFQLKGLFGGEFWLIGTKMDENDKRKIGRTRLIDSRKEAKKVLKLLYELRDEPQTIHAKFDRRMGVWRFEQEGRSMAGLPTNLAGKWRIVSQAYHNSTEVDTLSKILNGYEEKLIHDAACGAGFHAILLAQQGWKKISVSDGDPDNFEVLSRRMREKGVHLDYKHAKFSELRDAGFANYDGILCLGSSLTYCDSWVDANVDVASQNAGVLEALGGLKAALSNPSGLLIIGNSKLYKKPDTNCVLKLDPTQLGSNTYWVTWNLTFNWTDCIKHWHCEIKDARNDIEFINMNSHLFDEEMLKELCRKMFLHVAVADTPNECPEYYVLCSDSLETLEALKKNVTTRS